MYSYALLLLRTLTVHNRTPIIRLPLVSSLPKNCSDKEKFELEKTQLFDVMHDIQHKASSIIGKNVSLWLGILSLLQCSYVKEKK